MKRFLLQTLGCRANTADSASLSARLRALGYQPTDSLEQAQLVVINTCSVTAGADADARRLARRAARVNPAAELVVTGCLAERAPQEVASWGVADRVVGNRLKLRLPELLAGSWDGAEQELVWEQPEAQPLYGEVGRTRAFLKVQDGCDARCSFCVIPTTRGPGRSVPPERVEAEVQALARQSVREVVLSGIHLGRYGRDLGGGQDLPGLLRRLLRWPRPERLRLTSIEPREVTPQLLELMAGEPRLVPHLHVPLQSGSDRVLALMRRPYTARHYAATIEAVARALPRAAIGADLMVGFPGESEHDFGLTLKLVGQLPISYLHVFRFSSRPGTDALGLPGQVSAGLARERSLRLRLWSRQRNQDWRRAQLGTLRQALVLDRDDFSASGLTDNYIRVELPRELTPNQLLTVRLSRVSAEATGAEPAGTPADATRGAPAPAALGGPE